jgi:hypothetical protein
MASASNSTVINIKANIDDAKKEFKELKNVADSTYSDIIEKQKQLEQAEKKLSDAKNQKEKNKSVLESLEHKKEELKLQKIDLENSAKKVGTARQLKKELEQTLKLEKSKLADNLKYKSSYEDAIKQAQEKYKKDIKYHDDVAEKKKEILKLDGQIRDVKTSIREDNSAVTSINKEVKALESQLKKEKENHQKSIELQKQKNDEIVALEKKEKDRIINLEREAYLERKKFADQYRDEYIRSINYEKEAKLRAIKENARKEIEELKELSRKKRAIIEQERSKRQVWDSSDMKEYYAELENSSKSSLRAKKIHANEEISLVQKLQREYSELKEQYKKGEISQNLFRTGKKKLISDLRTEKEETEELNNTLRESVLAMTNKGRALSDYNRKLEQLQKARQSGAITATEYSNTLKELNKDYRENTAVRNSAINSIVRHIRQVETMIVSYYMLSTAWSSTIGLGVQLNKTVENNSYGLASLIASNTELVDSQGKVLSSGEKFQKALEISEKTMLDLKKASAQTSATFPELSDVFQQAIGYSLKMGEAFAGSTEEAIQKTIALTTTLTNMGSAIGMNAQLVQEETRSLFSGDTSRDSKLAILLFGTPANANKALKDAQEKTNGVFDLLSSRLKEFEKLNNIDTLQRNMDKLKASWETFMMDSSVDVFEDLNYVLKDLREYLDTNGAELSENIRDIYEYLKKALPIALEMGKAFLAYKAINLLGGAIDDGISRVVRAVDIFDKSAESSKKANKEITKTQRALRALSKVGLIANPFTGWASAIMATAFGIDYLAKKIKDVYFDATNSVIDKSIFQSLSKDNLLKEIESMRKLSEKLNGKNGLLIHNIKKSEQTFMERFGVTADDFKKADELKEKIISLKKEQSVYEHHLKKTKEAIENYKKASDKAGVSDDIQKIALKGLNTRLEEYKSKIKVSKDEVKKLIEEQKKLGTSTEDLDKKLQALKEVDLGVGEEYAIEAKVSLAKDGMSDFKKELFDQYEDYAEKINSILTSKKNADIYIDGEDGKLTDKTKIEAYKVLKEQIELIEKEHQAKLKQIKKEENERVNKEIEEEIDDHNKKLEEQAKKAERIKELKEDISDQLLKINGINLKINGSEQTRVELAQIDLDTANKKVTKKAEELNKAKAGEEALKAEKELNDAVIAQQNAQLKLQQEITKEKEKRTKDIEKWLKKEQKEYESLFNIEKGELGSVSSYSELNDIYEDYADVLENHPEEMEKVNTWHEQQLKTLNKNLIDKWDRSNEKFILDLKQAFKDSIDESFNQGLKGELSSVLSGGGFNLNNIINGVKDTAIDSASSSVVELLKNEGFSLSGSIGSFASDPMGALSQIGEYASTSAIGSYLSGNLATSLAQNATLQSMGLSQTASGLAHGYGAGVSGTYSSAGATSAYNMGAMGGGALTGAGMGYAMGSIANSLAGTQSRADSGGAIGGAIGGATGSVVPGVGTFLGAAIGSALGTAIGGAFGGKTRMMSSGIDVDTEATLSNFSDVVQVFENYKKRNLWKSKSWTEYKDLTDDTADYIEGIFVSTNSLTKIIGGDELKLGTDKFEFDNFGDTIAKFIISEIVGYDIGETLENSDFAKNEHNTLLNSVNTLFDDWSEIAKEMDTTVINVLAESLATFQSTIRDFDLYNAKTDIEKLQLQSQFATDDLNTIAESMGVNSAKLTVENFNKKYEEALKDNFSQETIDSWERLGDALITANNAQKAYNEYLEESTLANNSRIKAFEDMFKSQDQIILETAESFGVTIVDTYSKLRENMELLSNDADGLTDAELNLLYVNKELIDTTTELAEIDLKESLEKTISALEEASRKATEINHSMMSLRWEAYQEEKLRLEKEHQEELDRIDELREEEIDRIEKIQDAIDKLGDGIAKSVKNILRDINGANSTDSENLNYLVSQYHMYKEVYDSALSDYTDYKNLDTIEGLNTAYEDIADLANRIIDLAPDTLGSDQLGGLFNPLKNDFLDIQGYVDPLGYAIETLSNNIFDFNTTTGTLGSNVGSLSSSTGTLGTNVSGLDSTISSGVDVSGSVTTDVSSAFTSADLMKEKDSFYTLNTNGSKLNYTDLAQDSSLTSQDSNLIKLLAGMSETELQFKSEGTTTDNIVQQISDYDKLRQSSEYSTYQSKNNNYSLKNSDITSLATSVASSVTKQDLVNNLKNYIDNDGAIDTAKEFEDLKAILSVYEKWASLQGYSSTNSSIINDLKDDTVGSAVTYNGGSGFNTGEQDVTIHMQDALGNELAGLISTKTHKFEEGKSLIDEWANLAYASEGNSSTKWTTQIADTWASYFNKVPADIDGDGNLEYAEKSNLINTKSGYLTRDQFVAKIGLLPNGEYAQAQSYRLEGNYEDYKKYYREKGVDLYTNRVKDEDISVIQGLYDGTIPFTSHTLMDKYMKVFVTDWGFKQGGFTGFNIPTDEIAGVVHGGEYVAPFTQVKKYPELFKSLDNDRGYRNGGFVGLNSLSGDKETIKELRENNKLLKEIIKQNNIKDRSTKRVTRTEKVNYMQGVI